MGVDPDQGKNAAKDTPGADRGLGSPSSYQDQQLAALAYPSHTILASQLKEERDFFLKHVTTRAPKASGTAWQLVGPTTATQPAFLNFFNQYFANGGESHDFQVSGRVTAIAVDTNDCNEQTCRIWVAAAGGGIWRNDNALDSNSQWTYVSGGFGTNAIGTLAYNANTGALYAGTGEPNASGDSESGVGIYVSHDLGDHWKLLPGSPDATYARAVSSIAFDPDHPNVLYVGTTRAVRGVSAVTGGAVSLAPDAPKWGLWKSTNNGQSFSFMWDGNASARGVNHVEVDSAHHTVYAAAFGQGIWRSSDGGSTWEQVFATKDSGDNNARTEFALNHTSPGNHTRIYVGDGGVEGAAAAGNLPPSNTGVYRADSIDTTPAGSLVTGGTDAGYTSLTSDGTTPTGRRDPHFPTHDYCEGQCWYDNFVVSPPGHPDDVYVGGSFDYNAYPLYGGRAVLLSQDAGATWTEQTTSADMQVGIHPDQHALATDPANPLLFFEGSDGGVVRSSGQVVDDSSSFCSWGSPVTSSFNAACINMHKAVPTSLFTINDGLSTLQFQNVVVNPNDPSQLMGGTQDNGTWLGPNNTSRWNQTVYGDGGVAAFDAPGGDPNFEMNEFYDRYTDVNESGGDPTKWAVASGPFFASKESSEFYKPQIGDTTNPGTFFVGLKSVFRTQDYAGHPSPDPGPNVGGTGCSEFTTPGDDPHCGDFVALGGPPAGGPGSASDLTSSNFGSSRAGGNVSALARGSDSGTLWAATSTGRVFVSDNADATDASTVAFTRIDSLDSNVAPGRFVTGIAVDPSDPHKAWISYDGYNANTPDTPGHVFEVDYNSTAGTATWTSLDGNSSPLTDRLGDLPVTDIVRDSSTGMLYASTDFGVLASSGDGSWSPLGSGMPQVEVPMLTIDQSSHTLYAATHGRAIWSFSLGG
ncbi:MAG TPA: hypothetical protein VFU30_10045 [Gaiellaceae bacterium]|nr:hypothetical protein [Gaiellaceae bacterium]